MKNTHKSFLIVLLLMVGLSLSAQESPFSFIVKAGVNVSNTSLEVNPSAGINKKQPKIGFNAGVRVDYAFSKSFSLQSGLEYTTKGVQTKGSITPEMLDGEVGWDGEIHWDATSNLGYLQIPLLGVYRFNFTDDFNLFINIGPYFAYGINGKSKADLWYYNIEDMTDETQKNDSFGDYANKRFDMGIIGGLGADISRFIISFNFELGITDPSNLSSDSKNRNASISVGYRF